jgi:hypothetical protein
VLFAPAEDGAHNAASLNGDVRPLGRGPSYGFPERIAGIALESGKLDMSSLPYRLLVQGGDRCDHAPGTDHKSAGRGERVAISWHGLARASGRGFQLGLLSPTLRLIWVRSECFRAVALDQ